MEYKVSNEQLEKINCDGIIFGTYEDDQSELYQKFSDKINDFANLANFKGKKETILTLYKIEGISAPRIVIAGLGSKSTASHEEIRTGIALAAKKLRSIEAKSIAVNAVDGEAQAVAEGIVLGLYNFNELKSNDTKKEITEVTFSGTESQHNEWNNGIIVGEAQNFSRRLAELPGNIATPTYFVDEAKKAFENVSSVNLISHDVDWAEERKMGSFLSVTRGSDQPAKFLEIHYSGGNEGDKPVLLVGKGITFDTGGISIKPAADMGLMRADCTGAAIVLGSVLALAKLGVKMNVIGLTPLTENMPSGKATRPADVVYASNGKSIEIDNTDAEGRLILADALVYADSFDPHTVIDIATLTGAMMVSLGDAYVGVFSRSDDLWNELERAGVETHEKFWRMPLDELYKKQLKSTLADLKNVGGRYGGACIAAAFLGEFSTTERWAHLDIAGVMKSTKGAYTPEGIPAKPLRAVVQFVRNLV